MGGVVFLRGRSLRSPRANPKGNSRKSQVNAKSITSTSQSSPKLDQKMPTKKAPLCRSRGVAKQMDEQFEKLDPVTEQQIVAVLYTLKIPQVIFFWRFSKGSRRFMVIYGSSWFKESNLFRRNPAFPFNEDWYRGHQAGVRPVSKDD